MKILILTVGKEKDDLGRDLLKEYELRMLRYLPLEWAHVPHASKEKESEKILSLLKKEDYVVLLDEKGRELSNDALADLLANRMVDSVRRMVFIIGGSYGVTSAVQARANHVWRLSLLVLPHRLVRIILLEQLYRTMTILQGEQYHHE